MYKSKTNTCSVDDKLIDVYGAFFLGKIFLNTWYFIMNFEKPVSASCTWGIFLLSVIDRLGLGNTL
jgi:hypothetical protein